LLIYQGFLRINFNNTMPLPNAETVVIPAIAEKQFPHLWLSNVIISSSSDTEGRIKIETLPYNGTTGDIADGSNMVSIETSDLWQAVAECPEVQTAMLAIFGAVEPLRAWIKAKKEADEAAAAANIVADTPPI
jgi:hypothetical protein